jgi:rhodanese-related sulfurtransferase
VSLSCTLKELLLSIEILNNFKSIISIMNWILGESCNNIKIAKYVELSIYKEEKLMNKRILGVILVVVLSLGAFVGCGTSSATKKIGTAPDGNEVKIEAAAIKLAKGQQAGGYDLVSGEELKKWIDEGKEMVIIDTMPNDFYKKGHIPTALSGVMPKKSIEDATKEEKEAFIKLLGDDKEKTIVIYCGFTACGRSHVGATLAKSLGYKNVYRLPGGIIGWQDGKYEVEK